MIIIMTLKCVDGFSIRNIYDDDDGFNGKNENTRRSIPKKIPQTMFFSISIIVIYFSYRKN